MKKGQVTIFIIVAIVIVAVLVIVFYPRIRIIVQPLSPNQELDDCVSKELLPFVARISEKGGSAEPENTILYNNTRIEYLCYSNENYKQCIMQQPFLKQHVEEEISKFITGKANTCTQELVANYESKGYSVSRKPGNVSVEILPHVIKITINTPMTLTKGASQSFNKFIISKSSEMYDLLLISQTILNYEARYGDSNPETFMMSYPDLRIEKLKLDGGAKIYTLTNKETKERFVFASRSVVWPAGYGTS